MRFAYFRGGAKNLWIDGTVSGAAFTGSPRKATVNLLYPFPDDQYVVFVTGLSDERIWTVENKTSSSFTISSNADATISGVVMWAANPISFDGGS